MEGRRGGGGGVNVAGLNEVVQRVMEAGQGGFDPSEGAVVRDFHCFYPLGIQIAISNGTRLNRGDRRVRHAGSWIGCIQRNVDEIFRKGWISKCRPRRDPEHLLRYGCIDETPTR